MWQKIFIFIICNLAFIILAPSVQADFQFSANSTDITPEMEITAQVQLQLQGQSNKKYFLEGAFKKVDGSNYFGLTKTGENWVAYTSSDYSNLPEITTDEQGAWQGELKIKLDPESSNFDGDGDYILQIKRFTESGSGSFSDNQILMVVTGSLLVQASPSPSASASVADSQGGKLVFSLSQLPSSINSDQSFSVQVRIENDKPNQDLYLKGAFFEDGSTNYFGKVEVNGSWVKNSSTFSSQQKITTDSAGKWSGPLNVMSDDADSGFDGSGNYKFKIAKYTSSGSGPTWTDAQEIEINYIATPAPSAKVSPTPSSSTSSAVLGINSKSSEVSLSEIEGDNNLLAPVIESSNSATPAATFQETPDKAKYNWLLIGLGLTALTGSSIPLLKGNLLVKYPVWNTLLHLPVKLRRLL